MASTPNRRSIRLSGYDYTQPGGYFVTLLANNRAMVFGSIKDYSTHLSILGQVIEQEWQQLPRRFPHLELDTYIIMPNHFHGIILLNDQNNPTQTTTETKETFGKPVPGSIPTIIRSFKSSVTRKARLMKNFPPDVIIWQKNYYERVIRTPAALDRIREYILGNPALWEQDEYHPR